MLHYGFTKQRVKNFNITGNLILMLNDENFKTVFQDPQCKITGSNSDIKKVELKACELGLKIDQLKIEKNG